MRQYKVIFTIEVNTAAADEDDDNNDDDEDEGKSGEGWKRASPFTVETSALDPSMTKSEHSKPGWRSCRE